MMQVMYTFDGCCEKWKVLYEIFTMTMNIAQNDMKFSPSFVVGWHSYQFVPCASSSGDIFLQYPFLNEVVDVSDR